MTMTGETMWLTRQLLSERRTWAMQCAAWPSTKIWRRPRKNVLICSMSLWRLVLKLSVHDNNDIAEKSNEKWHYFAWLLAGSQRQHYNNCGEGNRVGSRSSWCARESAFDSCWAALQRSDSDADQEVSHPLPSSQFSLCFVVISFSFSWCIKIMWFDCACVQFTHESPKAQKYLLGAFEQLCADHEEALVPRVPHILKTFYDCDIVDEEVRKTHHKNT